MLQSLKKYYSKAIRTSIVAQDKLTKRWIHVFSVIEFQSIYEYPYNIPNRKWKDNYIRTGKSKLQDYVFYLCIDEIDSIDEAIKIFETPHNNYEVNGESIEFINSTFIKEPMGEFPLVFPSNFYVEQGVSSVIPKRKSGMLVWCQIDNERFVEKQFFTSNINREMLAIQQLSLDYLGFDIIEKREHLGNIYLSLPNPYFREVDVTLSTNPIGIFYKIFKRGKEFIPIDFRLIDKHSDAIALDKLIKIEKETGFIELPHEPNLFELKFYNKKNELIGLHKPATFLKSIQLDLSIKEADLKVSVKTDKETKNFTVEKFSKPNTSLIGKSNKSNLENYFKTADDNRKYKLLEKNKEFIFFKGGKNEIDKTSSKSKAKNIIRDIINSAKDTCYLCDPYFNDLDLVDYAFYIKNNGVKIRILNSKEFLDKEKAEQIVKVLESYNSKPFSKIEVRVLRGKSILHDRFIVADEQVWFIGSSFNEFGARATCIAKIPKSSDKIIIREIEKWYNSEVNSQDISEYLNNISQSNE